MKGGCNCCQNTSRLFSHTFLWKIYPPTHHPPTSSAILLSVTLEDVTYNVKVKLHTMLKWNLVSEETFQGSFKNNVSETVNGRHFIMWQNTNCLERAQERNYKFMKLKKKYQSLTHPLNMIAIKQPQITFQKILLCNAITAGFVGFHNQNILNSNQCLKIPYPNHSDSLIQNKPVSRFWTRIQLHMRTWTSPLQGFERLDQIWRMTFCDSFPQNKPVLLTALKG